MGELQFRISPIKGKAVKEKYENVEPRPKSTYIFL